MLQISFNTLFCILIKSYLFMCILHFLGALKISYRAECWKEGGGPRLPHSKLAALGQDTRCIRSICGSQCYHAALAFCSPRAQLPRGWSESAACTAAEAPGTCCPYPGRPCYAGAAHVGVPRKYLCQDRSLCLDLCSSLHSNSSYSPI